MLPEKLKDEKFRFVLIDRPVEGNDKTGKRPKGLNWQKEGGSNYAWNDKTLAMHTIKGGNYGVVCGFGNLVVVDADTKLILDLAEEKLPPTFTVKSGRLNNEGRHYYYFCDDIDATMRLIGEDKKAGDIGDIKSWGGQVVGPGCNHWSGGKYEVLKDLPIATIKRMDLVDVFDEFIKDETTTMAEISAKNESLKADRSGYDDLPLSLVINTIGFTKRGRKHIGAHPIHGSSTGTNLHVDLAKGVWCCKRCGSGGGGYQWLAVTEGIIQCHQSVKGGLRDELWNQTLEIAAKKYGIKKKQTMQGRSAKSKFRFDVEELSSAIMDKYEFIYSEVRKELYYYDKGVFLLENENIIGPMVRELLGSNTNISRIKETMNFILTTRGIRRPDITNINPGRYINLANGVFDLQYGTLLEHSTEFLMTKKHDVSYNPQAQCPAIDKFLEEVLPPDEIENFFALSGYCLLEHYNFQHIFIFVGGGANGKSTLLNLLKYLIGQKYVSGIDLQSLENETFARAMLPGKSANICGDLPDSKLKHTGMLKQLTGGDVMQFQKKYGQPFDIQNTAKLIFACNKMPQILDDTDAWVRRVRMITCPNQFNEESRDPHMYDKITTEAEMQGYLLKSLEAYLRLEERGDWQNTKSMDDMRELLTKAMEPIAAFAKDRLITLNESFLTKEDVYLDYATYCKEHNLAIESKQQFSLKLGQHVQARSSTEKIGTRTVKVWEGIAFVDREVDYGQNDEEGDETDLQVDTPQIQDWTNFERR